MPIQKQTDPAKELKHKKKQLEDKMAQKENPHLLLEPDQYNISAEQLTKNYSRKNTPFILRTNKYFR